MTLSKFYWMFLFSWFPCSCWQWPCRNFCCSHIHVMLLATTAYLVCIVGIILMYIWYVPEPSCLLNIFFITWTLVLLQLMTSVSLHPKVSLNCLFSPNLLVAIWVVKSNLSGGSRWMLVSWLRGSWDSMLYSFAGVQSEGMAPDNSITNLSL